MELLPDELFLFIFEYIRKDDILYSFSNPNQRFQNILAPFFYDVDLTQENISYKQLLFITHILPGFGFTIHSLKLARKESLRLVLPSLPQLINLRILNINNSIDHTDESFDDFLIKAVSSLPSLSELTLAQLPYSTLTTISSCVTSCLTKLTLNNVRKCDFNNAVQMPSIRCLSLSMYVINLLDDLFKMMPNIEELNLSIPYLNDFEELPCLEKPETIHKLHVEIGHVNYKSWFNNKDFRTNFQVLKQFLDLFQSGVRSLTLIIINTDEEFSNFDQFYNLVENYTHLQMFEYYIQTQYMPDLMFSNIEESSNSMYSFFTLPKLLPFDSKFDHLISEFELNEHLTLPKLFNSTKLYNVNSNSISTIQLEDNYEFVNLLEIKHISDNISSNLCQFLFKLIDLSPNLTTLHVDSNDKNQIIELLNKILPKKRSKNILHFNSTIWMDSINYTSDRSFFYKLSKLLPRLKTIKLVCTRRFLCTNPSPINGLIEDFRQYFSQITNLRLHVETDSYTYRTLPTICKRKLDKDESLYYSIESKSCFNIGYLLNIWL